LVGVTEADAAPLDETVTVADAARDGEAATDADGAELVLGSEVALTSDGLGRAVLDDSADDDEFAEGALLRDAAGEKRGRSYVCDCEIVTVTLTVKLGVIEVDDEALPHADAAVDAVGADVRDGVTHAVGDALALALLLADAETLAEPAPDEELLGHCDADKDGLIDAEPDTLSVGLPVVEPLEQPELVDEKERDAHALELGVVVAEADKDGVMVVLDDIDKLVVWEFDVETDCVVETVVVAERVGDSELEMDPVADGDAVKL